MFNKFILWVRPCFEVFSSDHCCLVHWTSFIINFVDCQNFHVIPVCFPHNRRVVSHFSPENFHIICYFFAPCHIGHVICIFLLTASESMKLTIKIKAEYTNFKPRLPPVAMQCSQCAWMHGISLCFTPTLMGQHSSSIICNPSLLQMASWSKYM